MIQTNFKGTEIGMIPEDWEKKNLGEEVELCYGKGLPKKNRIPGPYPVFGSNGIVGSHNEFLVEGPGIIIGRKGSVGEVKFSKNNFWPIDTTYYLKVKKKGSIDFWYYFLLTLKLNRMNSHSAVPGLNRDMVYELKKKIPDEKEQNGIAKILSDLDSKIELLQKQNKTLEAIGQAIFKHWFVDFEFPNEEGKHYKSSGGEMVFYEELGKEIPKGWEAKPLDRIANFLNGLALQKFPPEGDDFLPVIKIKEIRQGITEQSDKASPNIDKKYVINDGDVLFSWSGTLMVVIWGEGKGALNQHLFKVTSDDFEKWFYYYWIKNHLRKFIGIAKDKTTTMGHIKSPHLTASIVLVPNDVILERMNEIMNSFIYKKIKNKLELRMLISLRDSLLPKLMSGEIRVGS
jgi:type I restriction enzyme S subunit